MGIWDEKVVEFLYVNHRGVEELRRVVPMGIYHGPNKWYPHSPRQWYLVAWCLDRQAQRTFKMDSGHMQGWSVSDDQSLPWRQDEQASQRPR